MLTRARLLAVAAAIGVAPEVAEKDYVLSWVLWAMFRRPLFREALVFKGGTCLRKCYVAGYRFSEDLDFTAVRELDLDAARENLAGVCAEISQATNVDFDLERIVFESVTNAAGQTNIQGQLFYQGPRGSSHARVKLDISLNEELVLAVEERWLIHEYDDADEVATVVPCYALNEVVAEKLRALLQRNRARDLYDVWWLLGNRREELDSQIALDVFAAKTRSEDTPVGALQEIVSREKFATLSDHWDSQIGHQLPDVPALQVLQAEIQALLIAFITEGTPAPTRAALSLPRSAQGAIRTFAGPRALIVDAARRRLVLELRYSGRWRHVEPYSFVLGKNGDEQLFAHELEDGHVKRYRIHRIEDLRETATPFLPRYPIEIG